MTESERIKQRTFELMKNNLQSMRDSGISVEKLRHDLSFSDFSTEEVETLVSLFASLSPRCNN